MSFLPLNKKDKLTKVQLRSLLLVTLTTTAPAAGSGIIRGRGTSFFPVKHEKLPPSYIQDAKNFSVVKPLNSGEARASPASPVPRPLIIFIDMKNSHK